MSMSDELRAMEEAHRDCVYLDKTECGFLLAAADRIEALEALERTALAYWRDDLCSSSGEGWTEPAAGFCAACTTMDRAQQNSGPIPPA